jgi:hypothetical protein
MAMSYRRSVFLISCQKHGNDGAELSINNTSYCADGDIGDRHVVDAAYIDGEGGLVGGGYKSYVLTSNTTIGASVV